MKKVQENQKNQKKKNKGFTLVELIIVIAIIAILAIVLAPQYIKYVEKSRWSNDVNQMSELEGMVKTAIVEAQEKEATAAEITGTIVVTKTADATITSAVSLKSALDGVDANWAKYHLKNNGSHKSEASSAGKSVGTGTSQYTITISQDTTTGLYTVVGSWN